MRSLALALLTVATAEELVMVRPAGSNRAGEIAPAAPPPRAGSPDCDTFTDCGSCSAATSWSGTACRWCPLNNDESCHAYGSLENSCSSSQQVTDPAQCADLTSPSQLHLAFGGDAAMRAMWHTKGRTTVSTAKVWPLADGEAAGATSSGAQETCVRTQTPRVFHVWWGTSLCAELAAGVCDHRFCGHFITAGTLRLSSTRRAWAG